MCTRRVSYKTVFMDNIFTVILWVFGLYFLYQIELLYSILYLIYIPFSVLWFWRHICCYCSHYDTGCCPCGYGNAAPKLFLFRDDKQFKRAFNRNIAIVFPYWFLPLIAGLYLLWTDYSQLILILFIISSVVGFVVVPLVSKMVGCKDCPTKDNCPWAEEGMKGKRRHF